MMGTPVIKSIAHQSQIFYIIMVLFCYLFSLKTNVNIFIAGSPTLFSILIATLDSTKIYPHLERFKKAKVKETELREELKFVINCFESKTIVVDRGVFLKHERKSNFIVWFDEGDDRAKIIEKDHFVALYMRARQLKKRDRTKE